MLRIEENERLTRVGPGTPMGALLRQYWHPVAATAELDENPVKQVKILGESLVLFRDRQGRLGLIDDTCPHRRVSFLYGIPEAEGLRCCYHGWMFDRTGRCLEMPAEAPDSTFKDRVRIAAYPVQELGGLIFAYLGPEPAPLLPRWDLLTMDHVWRDIGVTVIPCNWLQCMENSVDPVHTEWLHGHYYNYVLQRKADKDERGDRFVARVIPHHAKIGFWADHRELRQGRHSAVCEWPLHLWRGGATGDSTPHWGNGAGCRGQRIVRGRDQRSPAGPWRTLGQSESGNVPGRAGLGERTNRSLPRSPDGDARLNPRSTPPRGRVLLRFRCRALAWTASDFP